MGGRSYWDSDDRIAQAISALRDSESVLDAVEKLSFDVTYNGLKHAFKSRGMESPSAYLRRPVPPTPAVGFSPESQPQNTVVPAGKWASCSRFAAAIPVQEPRQQAEPRDYGAFTQLVEEARKAPDFSTLCDRLDVAPSKARQLIAEALASGVAIRTGEQVVALGNEPNPDVQDTGIKPTVGDEQTVGVISDLHFGSKYCMTAEIRECVERMYARGVREILMPGDLLDGCYDHGRFELTHVGIEDQTESMCENLPELPGLRYLAITGNHDETFFSKTGLNIGRYIEGYFADHGRRDVKFYGDRGATLRIRGTTIEMWHPMGGGSYAVSYNLQKRVETYDSGLKPGILLVGHYHRCCYAHLRGVHSLLCPTMQRGGSRFGNALGKGSPAIGGLILSWQLTEDQTIREFGWRKLSYYWREQPKEIEAA